jgi:hypothetical protein
MATRIQPTRKLSQQQKVERARAATDRLSVRLAEADGESAEIDIAQAPLSWWRARWADKAIRRTFIENFIYVRDAFDENRLVLLKYNDLQADFSAKRSGKDVGIKFRRGGFSTVVIAEDFADCIVLSGRTFRCVPHDPDTESEFRTTIKIMFENLASHLKPATRYYSDERIWIDDQLRGTVDSRITTSTVTPGHESKGRGQTITNLLLTEPPHWRGDQRKAATALIEAAAGGKIMVESTPFGIDWTYAIYQQGKKHEAGWTSHFYQWWWKRDYRIEGSQFRKARGACLLLKPGESLRDIWKILPANASENQRAANRVRFEKAKVTGEEIKVGRLLYDHLRKLGYVGRGSSPTMREGSSSRTQALLDSRATAPVQAATPRRRPRADRWRCDDVAEYIAWRRSKIEELPGGERQFQVEYPENDQDCFEQSGRPVISAAYLKEPCEPSERRAGRTYLIGVDSSLGLAGGNPAAIAVIDEETGRMCHSEKMRLAPDLLAYRVGELHELYNGALIVPERNNTGVALIQRLCDLGYTDFIYRHLDERLKRQVEDGKKTIDEAMEEAQLGFPTTFQGASSKSHAAMMLEESIRKGELGVDQAFIDEAVTVIWFDNETFGPMPGQDHHADLFMATLIVNYVKRTRASMQGGFIGILPEVGYAR